MSPQYINSQCNTMKKVLIWDTCQRLNIGGPSGYLYNIRDYLQSHPTDQISFLTDLVLEKGGKAEWLYPKFPIEYQPKTFVGKALLKIIYIYIACIKPFVGIEVQIPRDVDINEYDYIHIHQVTQLQQFKKIFPNYRGKVILTSHSPCPFTDELIERAGVQPIRRKLVGMFRPFLLRKECDAYDKTDYIMFPCAGAREPYEKFEKMRKTFMRNDKKFFYLPSSIVDYHPNSKTQQKLSEFNIPSDAFVITYFGRHTPIKGYDILTKTGMMLLDKYPNLYFLCAGNGSILPPYHPRWIELGYISNVDDLLPQSDLYILPNRETYFDLITLQILRAGVPVALSRTGGNKYFLEFPKDETRGILFFDIDDNDKMITIVEDIMRMKNVHPEQYVEMKHCNRELYEHYFTLDKYIHNYLRAVSNLQ